MPRPRTSDKRVETKSGSVYYAQPSPEARGFKKKNFSFPEAEGLAMLADAQIQGFEALAPYLRHLWAEDRKRRGLPPWLPELKGASDSKV